MSKPRAGRALDLRQGTPFAQADMHHPSSPTRSRQRQHTSLAREVSLIYLEELLRALRGEALVIATLSYGLAVPLSALREIRVRDVGLFDKTILMRGREYVIPPATADDLRDFFQERVCGSEVSPTFDATRPCSILRDLLFSDSAFADLEETMQSIETRIQAKFVGISTRPTLLSTDSMLQVLGRLHRRYAVAKKHLVISPLDLFDKGPQIVRRGRGGAVDAYYLWRASRILASC